MWRLHGIEPRLREKKITYVAWQRAKGNHLRKKGAMTGHGSDRDKKRGGGHSGHPKVVNFLDAKEPAQLSGGEKQEHRMMASI